MQWQRRNKGARYFRRRRKGQWLKGLIIAVFALVFLFCAFQLISYFVDAYNARQASAALREAYHAPTESPVSSPSPSPSPSPTAAPQAPAPSAPPPTRLSSIRYPNNPSAQISARFQKIRRQNQDIIGWLTIENLIDEAVVQRDNEYYLDRDYRGYHNVNGAIFLDESCNLKTRPYTLLLYGHNMKTGLMFGALRNYENLSFYKKNPFVTFDTAYEDGQFVIFAVATVSTVPYHRQYVDFSRLCSSVIADRESALETLLIRSVYRTQIDVNAQDQLLFLVTCVEDDQDRRVVAARRIRDGETQETLLPVIQRTINRAGN